MNWKEIRLVKETAYPVSSITVFRMDAATGKAATHWVDEACQSFTRTATCSNTSNNPERLNQRSDNNVRSYNTGFEQAHKRAFLGLGT